MKWAAMPKSIDIGRVILVSPFTSLIDMAHLLIGSKVPGLSWLLQHNYDNMEAVETLCNKSTTHWNFLRSIVIFHGPHDRIIPVEMGRRLANMATSSSSCSHVLVQIIEPEAGHNDIFVRARDQILSAMTPVSPITHPILTTQAPAFI